MKSDMVPFEVFCTDILLKYGRSHSHDGISDLEAMINVIKPEIIAFQKPEREIKQWKTGNALKSLLLLAEERRRGNEKNIIAKNHCFSKAGEGNKAMENKIKRKIIALKSAEEEIKQWKTGNALKSLLLLAEERR